MIYEVISMIALAFGAVVGLIALLNPSGIASALRLQADPDKPGGFAEFRATFGGVFLMIHASALSIVHTQGPLISAMVILPIAMGWYGAALARIVSMLLDTKENGDGGNNRYWTVLEIIIGTMLMANIGQLTA